MKKAIILVMAAATVAGAMTSADVDNNGGDPRNLAASFKCETIFPTLGFDYVFAGRVALGPVAKYDGESYAAGLASRIYLLGDSRSLGINPYVAAEGGYLHSFDTVRVSRGWNYTAGWNDNPVYNTEAYDCGYGFVGPGVDLRVPKFGLVPFMEIGPRRDFRADNPGAYVHWAVGLRYAW
jgi:hypothetical protein